MRASRWALLVCVVGLVGCGAPEAKPPAGAETSETKLDIEMEGGDAKPASAAPASDAPAASESPSP